MVKRWLPMVAALLISLAPSETSPALADLGDAGGGGGTCCWDDSTVSPPMTKDSLSPSWVTNHPERFDAKGVLIRRTSKDFSVAYRQTHLDRFLGNGEFLEDPEVMQSRDDLPHGFVEKHRELFNADGLYVGDALLLSTKEAMDPDFVTLHPEQFDAEGRYIGEPPPFFSLPDSCCTVPRALTAGTEWGLMGAALTVLTLGVFLLFRLGGLAGLWQALGRRQ